MWLLPFQPMPNYEHNMQSKYYIKCFETNMKRYTTKRAKVHLNSVMEKIRNQSIVKNKGQIQNFRRNTGDLKNSKHNLKYNFKFSKDADQQKEQKFVIYV